MALTPGIRLGPYELVSLLGAGGMGEVYKARDTRLGRDVALKIAKEPFSARFEREARATAQLSHPHICTLYDVGPDYLVMEMVEGETLSERLRHGPLPLDLAIRYGGEMCDALSAAHGKGIVHRDLKPGNVMVTKHGIKVLDFGVAKLHEQPGDTLTGIGDVMGTPAYMAPEQIAGRECDARADIFALGLVLIEMATGQRAVVGHGQAPSLSGLPAQFAHVVERCLAPEPEHRWQAASDLKAELEWAGHVQIAAPSTRRASRSTNWWKWPAAVLSLSVGLIGAAVWLLEPDATSSDTPRRFVLSFADQMAGAAPQAIPVPSPDGRYVVFTGGSAGAPASLWVLALDGVEPKPLAGTEGTLGPPVWSPDSRWIAFYADGKVKKISPSGGSPQTIADAQGFWDAAWGSGGDIIFRTGNRTALVRIGEDGGPPEPITTLDESQTENSHRGPVFLPDGRRFLFTSRCGQRDNNALYLASLDSRDVRRLLPVQSIVHYVQARSGHLDSILYYRDGGLVARSFNRDTAELGSDTVPVVDDVAYDAAGLGVGFQTSPDGRVAIVGPSAARKTHFVWFDRTGAPIGTLGEPGDYLQPRISPDGTRVAFTRPDAQTGNRDVWFIEISRSIASRLTLHVANDWFPVWSPDGRKLLFGSDRDGGTVMRPFLKTALDTASDETSLPGGAEPYDWSKDGKWIAMTTAGSAPSRDVLIAPAAEGAKAFSFLATPFNEAGPRFSPDGKWMAYVSDETGRAEVYVRPFAGRPAVPERKIQISNNGGVFPVWRSDGRELYYMSADFTLYVVDTTTLGASDTISLPSRLFRACQGTTPISPPTGGNVFGYNYDTQDGKRFLVNCGVEPAGRFVVLLDWPFTGR